MILPARPIYPPSPIQRFKPDNGLGFPQNSLRAGHFQRRGRDHVNQYPERLDRKCGRSSKNHFEPELHNPRSRGAGDLPEQRTGNDRIGRSEVGVIQQS